MADDQDNIADLSIGVTADYSELQNGLDEAAGVAAKTGDEIAQALQAAADASGLAGRDLENFQQILQADQQSGVDLAQSLQDIAASAGSLGEEIASGATAALENLKSAEQEVADAASNVSIEVDNTVTPLSEVSQAAHDAEGGLQGMAEQLIAVGEALVVTEGLREFGQEALEAFGIVQSVTIGMTQLTGSVDQANEAIEEIKQLAATEPFAFPDIAPTVQRMVALGVSMEQLPAVMQAAADAAAATGNGFNAAASAIDRMSLSGNAGARQLVALGLSVSDLGKVLGVTDDEVKQAFKDLDQSERIDALTAALGKFAGAAEAQAQGISGQWQIFKNTFEEVMVAVGNDIAPVVSDILGLGKTVLQVTQEATEAFKSLPVELQDIIVVFGLAAAAAVPLTGAIGAFGLALAGVNTLLPSLTALLGAAGIAATEDAAAEAAAAVATSAHGAAAAGAAGEIEALAGAETGAAAESGGLAAALGGVSSAMGAIVAYGAPVVAAIAVTVENLKTLKAAWSDVDATIKSQSLSDAINAGDTTKELQNIGFSVVDIKNHFSDMGLGAGTVMQQISTSISSPMDALKQLGFTEDQVAEAVKGIGTNAVTAFQALKNAASISDLSDVGLNIDKITAALNRMGAQANNAKLDIDSLKLGITVTASGFTQLSQNAAIVHANIDLLNTNLQKAKDTLVDVKAASDGTARSLQDVAAAAQNITRAQDALNTSQGISNKAVKDAADSWQALAAQEDKNNTALKNAQDTFDAVSSAYNSGKDVLNGVAINLKTLEDATKNLNDAQVKATGIVPAWVASIGSVAAAAQNEANAFQKTQDAVTRTSSVLAAYRTSYETNVVIPGTNIVATLGMIADILTKNQKAIEDKEKAESSDAYTIDQLLGKQADLASVMVNGQAVTLGMTKAQNDATQATIDAAQAAGDNTKAVVGQNNVDALHTAEVTTVAQALGLEQKATAASTDSIINNTAATVQSTAAKKAAADAAQALADRNQQLNMAWANGQIVIQGTTQDLVSWEDAAGGATDATQALLDRVKEMAPDMVSAGEETNEFIDQLNALADAADNAANAVGNVGKRSGGGGGGSADQTQGQELLGATAIEAMQTGDPFLAQFLTPGSLASASSTEGAAQIAASSPENILQQLANATGQVIDSIYGQFYPAVQKSATAIQAATAAQNDNTAALIDQSAAIAADKATVLANAQTWADAIGQVIHTAYGDVQPALATVATSASTAASAITTLATATTTAAAATGNLGTAAEEVAAAAQVAIAAVVAALPATAKSGDLGTTFGPDTSNPFYSGIISQAAQSSGAGMVSNPQQYGPDSYGYTTGTQGFEPTTGNGGVNLTLNITGNTVATDQSIQVLAKAVQSAVISGLRSQNSLKIF